MRLDLADIILDELSRETAMLISKICSKENEQKVLIESTDSVRRKIEYGSDEENDFMSSNYVHTGNSSLALLSKQLNK